MSAVLILTPISSGTIAETASQSSDVEVNTPVAPIRGFNKIGGTTRAVSSTTSPTSPGKVVVVVEVLVLVSGVGSAVSDPPPHAEARRKIIFNKINDFLFLTKSTPPIFNFIQIKIGISNTQI